MNRTRIAALVILSFMLSSLSYGQHANETYWMELTVTKDATIQNLLVLGKKKDTPITIKSGETVLNLVVDPFYSFDDEQDATGIEFTASGTTITIFGEATVLGCEDNESKITEISTINNPLLRALNCEDNRIRRIDLSQNKALEMLYCSGNDLEYLDLSNNPRLTEVECNENNITSINLLKNDILDRLDCSENLLTSLDLSGNRCLEYVYCYGNLLSACALDSTYRSLVNLSCSTGKIYVKDSDLEEMDDNPGKDGSNHNIATSKNWQVLDAEKDLPLNNINFDCELSINNLSNREITIKSFPNPVCDLLQIETDNPITTVDIYNIEGKHVFNKSINNLQSFQLNVSSLQSGNYIIHFNSPKGTSTQQIIKE